MPRSKLRTYKPAKKRNGEFKFFPAEIVPWTPASSVVDALIMKNRFGLENLMCVKKEGKRRRREKVQLEPTQVTGLSDNSIHVLPDDTFDRLRRGTVYNNPIKPHVEAPVWTETSTEVSAPVIPMPNSPLGTVQYKKPEPGRERSKKNKKKRKQKFDNIEPMRENRRVPNDSINESLIIDKPVSMHDHTKSLKITKSMLEPSMRVVNSPDLSYERVFKSQIPYYLPTACSMNLPALASSTPYSNGLKVKKNAPNFSNISPIKASRMSKKKRSNSRCKPEAKIDPKTDKKLQMQPVVVLKQIFLDVLGITNRVHTNTAPQISNYQYVKTRYNVSVRDKRSIEESTTLVRAVCSKSSKPSGIVSKKRKSAQVQESTIYSRSETPLTVPKMRKNNACSRDVHSVDESTVSSNSEFEQSSIVSNRRRGAWIQNCISETSTSCKESSEFEPSRMVSKRRSSRIQNHISKTSASCEESSEFESSRIVSNRRRSTRIQKRIAETSNGRAESFEFEDSSVATRNSSRTSPKSNQKSDFIIEKSIESYTTGGSITTSIKKSTVEAYHSTPHYEATRKVVHYNTVTNTHDSVIEISCLNDEVNIIDKSEQKPKSRYVLRNTPSRKARALSFSTDDSKSSVEGCSKPESRFSDVQIVENSLETSVNKTDSFSYDGSLREDKILRLLPGKKWRRSLLILRKGMAPDDDFIAERKGRNCRNSKFKVLDLQEQAEKEGLSYPLLDSIGDLPLSFDEQLDVMIKATLERVRPPDEETTKIIAQVRRFTQEIDARRNTADIFSDGCDKEAVVRLTDGLRLPEPKTEVFRKPNSCSRGANSSVCNSRKSRRSVLSISEDDPSGSLDTADSLGRNVYNKNLEQPKRDTPNLPKSKDRQSGYVSSPAFAANDTSWELESDLERCSINESNDNGTNRKQGIRKGGENAKDEVLRRCGQAEPLAFDSCYPERLLQKCCKLGEGVYGEVFLNRGEDGSCSVMKIVPIEGDLMVNGERQKRYEEILSEIIIAMELSALRLNKKNGTSGFCEVKKVRCVRGRYPKKLLFLWEFYDGRQGSENDSPEVFDENQLYVVLELANCGKDLEAFDFNNAAQAYALLVQIVYTLAVGEQALQFEHRDLHWGNIMIQTTTKNTVPFYLDGRLISVPTRGVEVSIIDFTLSRISHDSRCIFNDLSTDPDLFNAVGDFQFEVYRLMKEVIRNDWKSYEPYTNVLWLKYVVQKMLNGVRYKRTNTRIHEDHLKKLRTFDAKVLDCKSAKDVIDANLLYI